MTVLPYLGVTVRRVKPERERVGEVLRRRDDCRHYGVCTLGSVGGFKSTWRWLRGERSKKRQAECFESTMRRPAQDGCPACSGSDCVATLVDGSNVPAELNSAAHFSSLVDWVRFPNSSGYSRCGSASCTIRVLCRSGLQRVEHLLLSLTFSTCVLCCGLSLSHPSRHSPLPHRRAQQRRPARWRRRAVEVTARVGRQCTPHVSKYTDTALSRQWHNLYRKLRSPWILRLRWSVPPGILATRTHHLTYESEHSMCSYSDL